MSSLALQHKVQRHRFSHHVWAALAARLPRPLRAMIDLAPLVPARRSAADLAAEQAQEVRKLARTYEQTDPGFAADLYAAAARHEVEGAR